MSNRVRVRIREEDDLGEPLDGDVIPPARRTREREIVEVPGRNGGRLKPNGNPRGRPVGKPNKITRVIKEAALLAVEQSGEPLITKGKDGEDDTLTFRGADGIVGYLRHVAQTDPKTMCMLLAKILPMQITTKDDDSDVAYESVDDVMVELQRRGLNAKVVDQIASHVFAQKVEHKRNKRNDN